MQVAAPRSPNPKRQTCVQNDLSKAVITCSSQLLLLPLRRPLPSIRREDAKPGSLLGAADRVAARLDPHRIPRASNCCCPSRHGPGQRSPPSPCDSSRVQVCHIQRHTCRIYIQDAYSALEGGAAASPSRPHTSRV